VKILIACEFSGVVRDAFAEQGHDAWSCDLLPTESNGPHIQGDVREILDNSWDMMIAHPPCTYLSNSGVSWLYKDDSRWGKMLEGARFFKELLDTDIPKICVENPIMHGFATDIIGRKQDQVIQPWMFGHTECKATCLWLKNLPHLVPTNVVKDEMKALPKKESQRLYYLVSSPDRGKIRSITFKGIAEAMAEQWG